MLSRSETEALRADMGQVARASAPELRAAVAALQRQLHAIGRDRSAFTIVFSYVLDGLVWRELERAELPVPFAPLTPEHPFVVQLGKGTRIADAGVVETFAAYGVVDAAGAVIAPVLSERPGDPLYDAARSLAAAVVASVRAHVALDAIQSRYHLRDRQQTLVIAYHELMWELVERFKADGQLSIPTVLVSPADAPSTDFGDLVFIVRGA